MTPGLQAGFGDLLGAPLLADLHALGFRLLRLDCQRLPSQDRFRQIVAEVRDARMRPLCIVAPDRLDTIPPELGGLDLEVLNEADLLGMAPAAYLEAVRAVRAHVDGRHTLWAGGVSNLTAKRMRWLRAVVEALPHDVGVTVHRYPRNGETPNAPQEGFSSRADEMAALLSIIGKRPWGCSETGYHTGPQAKGWWLWRRRWHWTDAQIACFAQQETAWWRDAGASFAVWYQLNDGASGDPLDRFGIRGLDGAWKPVARTLAKP